jgi:hypothetical protein
MSREEYFNTYGRKFGIQTGCGFHYNQTTESVLWVKGQQLRTDMCRDVTWTQSLQSVRFGV